MSFHLKAVLIKLDTWARGILRCRTKEISDLMVPAVQQLTHSNQMVMSKQFTEAGTGGSFSATSQLTVQPNAQPTMENVGKSTTFSLKELQKLKEQLITTF